MLYDRTLIVIPLLSLTPGSLFKQPEHSEMHFFSQSMLYALNNEKME